MTFAGLSHTVSDAKCLPALFNLMAAQQRFPVKGKNIIIRIADEFSGQTMEEDLLKVCTVCGKDYAAERQKRIAQDARADYARLKADAGRKGDRIIYRVVDEMLYLQLRQSELPMAAFPKDAAYNVAFMESKLKRYEQILREASMQQEQQRRSELHNGGREN